MAEEKEIEVVEGRTLDKEIVTVLEHSGLEKTQAEEVMEGFKNFFEEVKGYEQEAKAIVINDATQITEMKQARELRLKLKNIRVNAEKVRKERKEFFLRGGKAIDGLANVLKALIVPLEEHLDKQENYAERIEAERKQKLAAERTEELRPYVSVEMLAVYIPGLKDMTQGAFDILIANSKKAVEDQRKAEEEAEKQRIAAEEAKKAEEERIRKENEALKKEAEEKEKALAEERKKAEEEKKKADAEKAEADRKLAEVEAAKKKAEDDLKAQQEKEAKEKRDREAKEEADRLEKERKAEEEAKAQAKLEKEKAYRTFREGLGWTEETKSDYKEENTGDSIILWKKAGEFKIK